MLLKLSYPPGVYRNGTDYQAQGRWHSANLVRWHSGALQPVGGWRRTSTPALSGRVRGALAWRDQEYNRWLGLGSHTHLYVWSGGSVTDITPTGFPPGRESSTFGFGYGTGLYGRGLYGRARNVGSPIEATTWSLDTWGDYLVACASHDGTLYQWERNTALKAVAITNAPTECAAVVVTPERIMVALGAGRDPRLVQWSGQENNTVWTPTETNTAGDQQLQTHGNIVTGVRVPGETLILTSADAHVMRFVGRPLIYSFKKVGSDCGIFGSQSVQTFEGGAVWMGSESFLMYDGGAVRPLPCDVGDYIFSDINRTQAAKISAGHLSRFGEIWWFYCSAGSEEVDRYVIWNYRENHWSIGSSFARTAWVDAGVFATPLGVSADGYLYEHESGWTADGEPILSDRFVRGGPMEFGSGDQVMYARQLLPDERNRGDVQGKFFTRFSPNGAEEEHGPYTMADYTDVRFAGRQISARFEGQTDEDWRVGIMRVEAVPGGGR